MRDPSLIPYLLDLSRRGVVEEVRPGEDGHVRTVSVPYTNPGKAPGEQSPLKETTRPVHKIAVIVPAGYVFEDDTDWNERSSLNIWQGWPRTQRLKETWGGAKTTKRRFGIYRQRKESRAAQPAKRPGMTKEGPKTPASHQEEAGAATKDPKKGSGS
jgi:hypothetical protein